MPLNLRKYLPSSVNDTEVETFFGDSVFPTLRPALPAPD